MHARIGLALLLLTACPLPEDQFVLSGRVVDALGTPGVGVEVRLLRNQQPSEVRCDSLEPLETTQTDDRGRYAFSLIRQQITGGVEARRFFRVEVDHPLGLLISQTFWFPDADLDLGDLAPNSREGSWDFTEGRLDGHIAWRSEGGGLSSALDRRHDLRFGSTQREWRAVPIDSLGRYDVVPVEWAWESQWSSEFFASLPPASRGAECPDIDVTPCPLTDGRFVPFEFAPNTRVIVLNFKHETNTNPLAFHGLVLERTAARVRLDFNFVLDFDNWNRLGESKLVPRWQELSADRCSDPGVFTLIGTPGPIKPVLLRIGFEDEEGNLVPILSLAEISTR